MCVYVCVCMCARARARACACVRERACLCVRACVGVCVFVCMCVSVSFDESLKLHNDGFCPLTYCVKQFRGCYSVLARLLLDWGVGNIYIEREMCV